MWDRETGCPLHCFSLVVCRHPETQKWLAVEENKGRGWWLPGGFCECGDDHPATALKETLEESGVEVVLKGLLRVENEMGRHGGRQRVIYYAEPKDPNQASPKTVPDNESKGAAWLTVDELKAKNKLSPPNGLRGTELLDWATYIEQGGTIYPLAVFATEHTPVPYNRDEHRREAESMRGDTSLVREDQRWLQHFRGTRSDEDGPA